MESIASILLKHPKLRQLSLQLRLLNQAQSCLERALPADLASHARAAAIIDGSLLLQADSPAWAARLRYMSPVILNALQCSPALSTIRSVRIKTAPDRERTSHQKSRSGISPCTAQLLRDVAESIQDPGLRASLLRLSRR